jgi:hypothetical protein
LEHTCNAMRSVEQSEEFLSDELFQVCQLGDSAATAGDGRGGGERCGVVVESGVFDCRAE